MLSSIIIPLSKQYTKDIPICTVWRGCQGVRHKEYSYQDEFILLILTTPPNLNYTDIGSSKPDGRPPKLWRVIVFPINSSSKSRNSDGLSSHINLYILFLLLPSTIDDRFCIMNSQHFPDIETLHFVYPASDGV
jgi:hypothetical protein